MRDERLPLGLHNFANEFPLCTWAGRNCRPAIGSNFGRTGATRGHSAAGRIFVNQPGSR
jgi:hypothetical protein